MSEMLTAVSLIFIVAGPFLLLANRYGLPTAPLLIIAGIPVGFMIDEDLALQLAEFGIALLVFTFGVGIQISAIRTVLADSELAAMAQMVLLGALGTGLGLLLGVSLEESLYLGVAAALSSTIVATAVIETEVGMTLVEGRLGQSIHFVQDLVAVAFILVISAGVLELDPIVLQIGYGVLLLIAAVLVNRYLFDAIGRLAGGSNELMIVGVISLLVLFIGAAEAVDVPIVVGAFAAGLAVRHDRNEYLGLFNGLESVKDFFVAIFFVTIGALIVLPFVEIGPAESVEKLALVAGLVVLTVVVKPVVTTAILIYRGYAARTSTLAGLSTDQVSEFALIIAIQALALELLTQAVFDAIILAAAVTMITSTYTYRYGEDIYRLLADRVAIAERHGKVDEFSHVPEDIEDHVIVVGYGRKGKRIVRSLEAIDCPYVVVDYDPARREAVSIECDAYVFGDAIDAYTWEKANVEEAKLIISGTPSPTVSRRLLAYDFDVDLILRAEEEAEALELLEAGATYVAVPDFLASEELIGHVRGLVEGSIRPEELRAAGQASLEDEARRGLWEAR